MRKLIVSIVFLALIGFSLRNFFSDKIPELASKFLATSMNIPVELDKATFYKDFFQIEGLSIKNPNQSVFKNAMTVQTIKVEAPYSRYIFADPLVIQNFFLENVNINLEISKNKTTACNWNVIGSHVKANRAPWYSNERKVFIKKLVIRNLTIGVKLYGKKVKVLSPISIIEFKNIDVNHGLPMQEISKIIVNKLMDTVFSAEAFKQLMGLPLTFFVNPFDSSKKDSCSDYKTDSDFKALESTTSFN